MEIIAVLIAVNHTCELPVFLLGSSPDMAAAGSKVSPNQLGDKLSCHYDSKIEIHKNMYGSAIIRNELQCVFWVLLITTNTEGPLDSSPSEI